MNNRIGLLTGLLVVQLVIIAALVFAGTDTADSGDRLLDMSADAVQEIVIAGQDEQLSLSKADDEWRIGDLPADQSKAAEFVSDFAEMPAPFPVSTTGSSVERFEVGDDNFQRRLTFRTDDGERVVFLGTSPGYQRVHARRDGEDDVFAIRYSNFKAPTSTDDWLDKTLLAADGAVSGVGVPGGWTLSRGDNGWLVDGTDADPERAATFAERFENLRVLNHADALPEGASAKGALVIQDDAGDYQLSFAHDEAEDDYYVESSRMPGYFKLATYSAEQMLVGSDELLPSSGEAGEEAGDDADVEIEADAAAGPEAEPAS